LKSMPHFWSCVALSPNTIRSVALSKHHKACGTFQTPQCVWHTPNTTRSVELSKRNECDTLQRVAHSLVVEETLRRLRKSNHINCSRYTHDQREKLSLVKSSCAICPITSLISVQFLYDRKTFEFGLVLV
jgi:hypothetical protein